MMAYGVYRVQHPSGEHFQARNRPELGTQPKNLPKPGTFLAWAPAIGNLKNYLGFLSRKRFPATVVQNYLRGCKTWVALEGKKNSAI